MRLRTKNFDNRGITIVIAVLILSIVVIITFAIGTLAIREIRNSRLQTHSEPAISAASGGAETILFFRGRELSEYNDPCPNDTVTESFGASAPYNSAFEACTIYYGQEEITSAAGNEKSFLLNNPLNPGDIEAGYTSVTMENIVAAGGTNTITVDKYDLSFPTVCPVRQQFAATGNKNITGLSANTSYALFIYPCAGPGNAPSCGGSTTPSCSSGSITATLNGTANTDDGTFSGVPLENPIIESTGERQGQLRKLQIELDKTP
jgi:hypothetical protein